jgi:hypothetical protein
MPGTRSRRAKIRSNRMPIRAAEPCRPAAINRRRLPVRRSRRRARREPPLNPAVTAQSPERAQARRVQRANQRQPQQALVLLLHRGPAVPHPARVRPPPAHRRARPAIRPTPRRTTRGLRLKIPLCRLESRRFLERQLTRLRTVPVVRLPVPPLPPCRPPVPACRMPPPWRHRPRPYHQRVPQSQSRRLLPGKPGRPERLLPRRTIQERRPAQILRQRPMTRPPFQTHRQPRARRPGHRQLTRQCRPSWRQALKRVRPRRNLLRRLTIRSWIQGSPRRVPWERPVQRRPRWPLRQCRLQRQPQHR